MNNSKLLITHPILSHQKREAQFVLKYAKDILNVLKIERKDLIDVILIDVIIKLFRIYCCEKISCTNCVECNPGKFMSEDVFIKFINNKPIDIIKIIKDGFNNSFNVPQRGMVFQYVIDKIFGINDNLIIFEIGCGGGLIGKVLCNSNYSKIFFKENGFSWDLNNDERFVQYYGIDPNLINSKKLQLMMINGSSQEMQIGRNILRKFNNDVNFNDENVYLQKLKLEESNIDTILHYFAIMIEKIKLNKNPLRIIFITSIMKYHFKNLDCYIKFKKNMLLLSGILNKVIGVNEIYYISNEVYGGNGLLYPFESDEYNKLLVKLFIIKDGIMRSETEFPELSRTF